MTTDAFQTIQNHENIKKQYMIQKELAFFYTYA